MQVVAYVCVSTQEQADSRAGLSAQRAAIKGECKRRGWTMVETIEDAGYSAKDLKRPGIQSPSSSSSASKRTAWSWRS